jgi:hypothetical protein
MFIGVSERAQRALVDSMAGRVRSPRAGEGRPTRGDGMSRLTMVLAAAVATGMLVIAVSTLDAVGADPPAKAAKAAKADNVSNELTRKLADCLRSRGVAVPALSGTALDRWLRTHPVPDADGLACKQAIVPPDEVRAAPTADTEKLSECLRAQGFHAPTDPLALKQWIGEQRSTAALRAIKKCGVDTAPAPCGAAKPAPKPTTDGDRPVT